MVRRFATRYTVVGEELTAPATSRVRAINFARALREHIDSNALVVSRQPGGEWEHEWPKPENCFPVEIPAHD